MKKILITGATGFIGQHLIQYLHAKQVSIRILARQTQNNAENIETFQADLTKADSLKNVCNDIDTVFHLAGFAHAFDENKTFAKMHELTNFIGTKNLLNEARRAGVKQFIFISSVKAVGDSQNLVDENWDKFPSSPYGIAKRKAEQAVLDAQKWGMHVCVLRPALVYGPGWKGNLNSMLNAIKRGLFPPLPKLKNARSMISVIDLCQAAWLAALKPEANGKTYFVTDGMTYSTEQLYSEIYQALQKTTPRIRMPYLVFKLLALSGDIGKKLLRRRLPFDSEALNKLFGSAHYDSKRIMNELGFKPEYNFKKMLPEIIANQ